MRGDLADEPLVRYSFFVVAHRDSPEGRALAKLPATSPITAEQLAGWRLIGLDPQSGLRQRLEKLAEPTSLTFAPDTHTGGWPAALAYAQQSLGAALVPTATLSSQAEPSFVTRPFDESFTLDEFRISRADFSNQALEVTKSALRDVTT